MGQSVKRNIGNILLDGGFLLRHELDRALEEQKHTKELLGQVLVRHGVLKPDEIKVPLLIQEHLGTIENAVKIVAGGRQTLGALLVHSGQINDDQLNLAISEQQRTGEKLGKIFKRFGLLTKPQLNALLDFQRNQEGSHASPLRLGELLVSTGHITRDNLEEALHKQTETKNNIGDQLVESGYICNNKLQYVVRLQKMLLKSVLCAILALGISTGSEAGEMCSYSKQLQNSPMRDQYISKVATEGRTILAYNSNADNQVQSDASDDLYFADISLSKSKTYKIKGDELDSFSRNCLTCHDGGHASDIAIDYRNNPGNKTKTFDGTKQHPIGMDYAAYTSRDIESYKPASAFNSKMTFVNGRVGCTTCHNPLNPEKGHLVMSDTRSALCLTCHKR